jgi:hypothetical protein
MAMTQTGLILLLLAGSGAVFLVMDLVIGRVWAAGVAAALAVGYIGL